LQKIAHFNKVNRKNKKRDKPKKEDLSRVVHGAGLEPTITRLKDLTILTNLLENSSTSLQLAPLLNLHIVRVFCFLANFAIKLYSQIIDT
jgi:hypothetical protein